MVGGRVGHSHHGMLEFLILGEVRRGVSRRAPLDCPRAGLGQFRSLISRVPWEAILKGEGVQEGFKKTIFNAQERAVPMCQKMSRQGRRAAWLNRELWLQGQDFAPVELREVPAGPFPQPSQAPLDTSTPTGLPALRWEHAVALLAYTLPGPLYQAFNAAVREAGRSREEYLNNFHFKVLHFLLSEALRALRDARPPRCHHVYRGVQGIRFTAQHHQSVRFGQFTSTSLRNESIQSFGQDSTFRVETCYGVPIRNFSFFPKEEEVLIPPFEVFKVTNVTRDGDRPIIHLRSQNTSSTYNCELVKGDVPRAWSLPTAGMQGLGGSVAWHSVAQHGTAWHGTRYCGMAQPGTAWDGAGQYGMAQHSAARHGTVGDSMAWHGMGQRGVAQRGTARHGTA
ncbi:rho guanine nucleotide exchange factor 15-like [Egretta garzetta]|uniref:rho guanine nucleotide exchange factor 15-like n=1 Tax=Egretta garzetta TaxID=188379 RepID=UPI00051EE19D|nr:rho guanine nucleotide exchange factor 15-like [Egretta garzetta]